ncbi:MAG TPA: c-type cytochrome [Solirubrobacteraceae bacterium]|nr:c-type cytochrome [Solirubrobacteraceae bacterium]
MAKSLGRISTLVAVALSVVALGGCAIKHPTSNLVTGKKLFASNCASCHTLSHANSTGTVGPNLDDAFRQDRADGVKSTSIEGLVSYWIQYPNTQGAMPAMLLKGQDAQNVAAYVARVAAVPGQDTGALAAAVAETVNPTPAVGKTVFTGVGGCGSCHTLSAAATTGTVGPNLNTLKQACATPASQQARGATLQKCIETAITDPYKYLPAGYTAGIMPNTFSKTLSPSQIQALVAFLSSAAK